jgi:hypothetical protein
VVRDGLIQVSGHVVWAGGKATAKGVSSDRRYVYADGVAAGPHSMEGTR